VLAIDLPFGGHHKDCLTRTRTAVLEIDREEYLRRKSESEAKNRESDPHGHDPHAPGAKLDAGKLQPWLCIAGFSRALAAVAKVTTVGAVKYTPNGWMSVSNGPERYMEGFARHMLKLGAGETLDTDTGCLHKAQMIWNLLAALELELRETGIN
jgi:hypothetical protein